MDALKDAQQLRDGLEFHDWVEHVRDVCLTIADVVALKPGDRVHVLPLHRNLCDRVYPHFAPPRPALYPADFFSQRDTAVYVHGRNLRGHIEWGWERGMAHQFEFDVEYEPDHWHPLQDGSLPANDPLGDAELPWDVAGREWTEFAASTRVGWRGPMLLWSKVSAQPPVFTRIDLKALAWHATAAYLQGVLDQTGIERERRHLRCTAGDWFLTVRDLSDAERTLLEKRLDSVEIAAEEDGESRPAWDGPCESAADEFGA